MSQLLNTQASDADYPPARQQWLYIHLVMLQMYVVQGFRAFCVLCFASGLMFYLDCHIRE